VKKQISKFLSIVIPILLGVYLMIYKYNSFTPEQITEMKGYFKNANYFYIAISLFIAFLGFASRAYRWKYSLEFLGYKTKFQNNLMSICICYFMNLTIPRSGEISRAVFIKKYENVPFDKAFGTIVAERIVDFVIFLIFVIIAFASQFEILKSYLFKKIPLQQLAIMAVVGILSFVVFLLIWIYSNWKIVKKLKKKFEGLSEGITSIFKMEKKWYYIFHSIFIWLSYFLMFYITIFALKETSTISITTALIGFVIGSLAIGFTNSGFGAFPLLIAEIFLLYGISDTAGTAFGWLVWISQTLLTVFLGTLSFLLFPVLNRNK
jgi:glycosyltransferase 2 family protein